MMPFKLNVAMSFESGDKVRVTNKKSKYYQQIGRVEYAKVWAADGQKTQVEYYVLFGDFGDKGKQFARTDLELIKD